MAKAAKTTRSPGAGRNEAARRDAIVDATLGLVAERGLRHVSLAEIGAAAGMPLSALYAVFPDKSAIMAAFSARIDTAVLAGEGDELASEGRRDRLFDLLMRRFDALTPHRPAVRALMEDARRDPCLVLGSAPRLLRSMRWTLEAAGIGPPGLAGAVRTQEIGRAHVCTPVPN